MLKDTMIMRGLAQYVLFFIRLIDQIYTSNPILISTL